MVGCLEGILTNCCCLFSKKRRPKEKISVFCNTEISVSLLRRELRNIFSQRSSASIILDLFGLPEPADRANAIGIGSSS